MTGWVNQALATVALHPFCDQQNAALEIRW